MNEEVISADQILPGPPAGYVPPYSKLRLPLDQMNLYDRIMIPAQQSENAHRAILRRYRHVVGKYNKEHPETRFETRQMEGGVFFVQRTK